MCVAPVASMTRRSKPMRRAAGGWHVGERCYEVAVDGIALAVDALFLRHLPFQSSALFDRVRQLTKGVGEFHAARIEFEALRHACVAGLGPRQRGKVCRVFREQRGATIADRGLDFCNENATEDVRPRVVVCRLHAGAMCGRGEDVAVGPGALERRLDVDPRKPVEGLGDGQALRPRAWIGMACREI